MGRAFGAVTISGPGTSRRRADGSDVTLRRDPAHPNPDVSAPLVFVVYHYHAPGDDMTQPILWDQGARFASINYRITRAMADGDQRPM